MPPSLFIEKKEVEEAHHVALKKQDIAKGFLLELSRNPTGMTDPQSFELSEPKDPSSTLQTFTYIYTSYAHFFCKR